MRWTLAAPVLLIVLAPATALAGTPEDPEVEDPQGDAGVEGTALPGGEDFDILAAWFTTNDTGTWAHLELSSFDTHPEDVVFSVDATLSGDRWIGVGYGSYVMPFPPFRTQGFQGCLGAGDGQPNCTTLPGEMLDDRPGFAVRIPPTWIQDEPRLREPTARVAAYAMWPAVTFDEAGPGDAYPLPGNDTGDGNLSAASEEGSRPEPGGEDDRPVPAPSGVAIGLVLAAGVTLSRRATNRRKP